ncbi:hypothetical protein NST94_15120 [Paenibacillus sp. FSL H8-0282]|nr:MULTISPECIES: hypothetical protein [Paenibacillus]MDH6447572.1 hypothetical protein [Paenibacillus sp. PastF-4]
MMSSRSEVVSFYEDAYLDADGFIPCTVSTAGYIVRNPKDGILLLNVL